MSDFNCQRDQEKGIREAGKFLRQNTLLDSISCQLHRASKCNLEFTHLWFSLWKGKVFFHRGELPMQTPTTSWLKHKTQTH